MKQRLARALVLLIVITVVSMVLAAWVFGAFNKYGDLSYLIAVGSGAVIGGLVA